MIPALTALIPFAGKLLDKFVADPQAKAEAQLKLTEMAHNGELAKMANETELFKAEQGNLTERHANDMQSDSWLSKNVRPVALIYLMALFTLAFFMDVPESVLHMLRDLLMTVFVFYFGARTLEKVGKMAFDKKSKA